MFGSLRSVLMGVCSTYTVSMDDMYSMICAMELGC